MLGRPSERAERPCDAVDPLAIVVVVPCLPRLDATSVHLVTDAGKLPLVSGSPLPIPAGLAELFVGLPQGGVVQLCEVDANVPVGEHRDGEEDRLHITS